MGTNVEAFTNHSFPLHSGKAIQAEFEKRFNCVCSFIDYNDDKRTFKKNSWYLGYFETDDSNVEAEWESRNQLSFIYFNDKAELSRELIIRGSVAELSEQNQYEWVFFLDYLIYNRHFDFETVEYYKNYRRRVHKEMLLLGGSSVIYSGDKLSDLLLYQKNIAGKNSNHCNFSTLEQMLELAKKTNSPIFHYPLTQQWKKSVDSKYSYCIVIDDFKDLK